jgi:hypothetical protein
MNFYPPKLIAFVALALLTRVAATAQVVVNVDFNAVTGTYSGQGVFSDPGHNFWNGLTSTGGGSNFTASDGVTSTGVSVTFSGAAGVGNGGATSFATDLMSDYLYRTGSSPVTFTITGLTAGAAYEFYFYSQAGSSGRTDRHASFTLDGNSVSVTAENASSFIEGTNYVMFSLTPSGTSLSGSFAVDPGFSEAELNGFQIVQLAAVPEPATYALSAGLAVFAGTWVFRRRRAFSRRRRSFSEGAISGQQSAPSELIFRPSADR